jgi:hypothetical protein
MDAMQTYILWRKMIVQKIIDILSMLPPDTDIQFTGCNDEEAEEELKALVSNALSSNDLLSDDIDINTRSDWYLLPLREEENETKHN